MGHRRRPRLVLALLLVAPLCGQQAQLTEALGLLKAGKAREALPILLELYRSVPKDANVCEQLGIAYTQLGELSGAERFYREAARLNPGFWAARKNLATVLWFLDRKAESEREFQAVATALPADPVPHLYLGLAAHSRREYGEAVRQFGKAGGLASENPEVLPAVIESHLAAGEFEFPARAAERLAASERPEPVLLSRIGALLLDYGQYGPAAVTLEKLTSIQRESADGWRMLGEAYSGEHKTEQAFGAYSRATETDPKSAGAYVSLAEFASAHGNNDYALETTGRGLRQVPGSAELLFERGILLALKGDRNQADASWAEASKIRPSWNLPWLALGVSQLESGDAARAARTFQHARTLEPSDARGHYLYATALARVGETNSGQKRAEAVAAVRKSIGLNPRDARPHALLGQILLSAGETNAAALEWETAIQLDSKNETALYQLGLLYRKQGKAEEARRLLDRFQRAKAKRHAGEESLVEILRVVPEPRAR